MKQRIFENPAKYKNHIPTPNLHAPNTVQARRHARTHTHTYTHSACLPYSLHDAACPHQVLSAGPGAAGAPPGSTACHLILRAVAGSSRQAERSHQGGRQAAGSSRQAEQRRSIQGGRQAVAGWGSE